MQRKIFYAVFSVWLLMSVLSGCATIKYYNKKYPEDQQNYYFQLDSAECRAIAAGMSPTPQIHINQQGQERTSGSMNIYGPDGYSAYGTYNQNTYYDNSAAQWADIANMSAALGATIRQNNLYEACMCRRGWVKVDNSIKVAKESTQSEITEAKSADVSASAKEGSSTTPLNSQASSKKVFIDKKVLQAPFTFYLQLGIGDPIEISPNGKYLLSNNNSILKLISIENGRELKTYKSSYFLGASFSPDGNYILNLSYRPQLINTISGKIIQTFDTNVDYIFDFAFSSNGKYLALAENKNVSLWDLFSGEKIRDFEGSSFPIMEVSFGPHDKYIISWSNAWELKVWDIISGREVNTIQFWNSASFSNSDQPPGGFFDRANIDISSDGNLMVYAAHSMRERYPHKVELWDVIEGKKINTFDYLAKNIRDVFFTPNNRFVGLIIKDAIHILNISNGRIAKEIKGDFTDVLLDNSGKFLIAKEGKLNNQQVTLRDFEKGNIKKSFMCQLPSVSSIAFSKDGNFLYTVNSQGSVNQWDLTKGNMSTEIKGDKSYKTNVILSHYGNKLIYGGVENSIKIIDTNTGKEIKALSPFPDKYSSSINSVRLSPDGNLIAIQNSDKQLTVVNLKEDAENMVFENEYPINAVSISPDNKYLFAGGSNDFLNIYNIETQELKKSLGESNKLTYYLGYDNSITSIAIRPDSKYAAIANTNSIKLYNIQTDKIEKQYTISELIQTMAFVDENSLLTGNYDGVLKLFNLFTGETIMALKGHSAAIEQIAINPVGSMAVTLSSDDSLCLWDIRQGQALSKFASYDNSEWVFLTSEGYFNASSGGSKFINIRVSPTKVTGIGGEQLTKYFKYDAVMQKLEK